MKKFSIITLALLTAIGLQTAAAQNLNYLKNKAKGAVQNEVRKGVQDAKYKAQQDAKEKALENKYAASANAEGRTFYVSATTGSARADGLSAETPMKDLQKAITEAQDNDVILVAEGNYLGNMDRGYVEVGKFANAQNDKGKFLSFYGGYSNDFSERDPLKYITKFQPTEQKFIAPLFNINARRPFDYRGPLGNVVVDGFVFDFGENNLYCAADVNNEVTGTPNEGVLTGRFLEPDASPMCPKVGHYNANTYALHMDVEGNVRVANCVFVNCRDYALMVLMGKGHIEVCNNVFVSNRYSACQISGTTKDDDIDKVSLDFHHNTVLFTWTRTKAFEDMGQGFRFMNGIRTIDCHNNIFGCNSNCGVERCRYEHTKALEDAKQSNLFDNYYFANRRDLEIASAGVASISVPASRIEEAEQIGPKFEGNVELPAGNDAFLNAIDQAYLEGFMNLTIIQSQSYDANSTANQLNRAFGLNQQGSEIVRPSMYFNKYPWEKALDLFGKVADYGAQMPQ